MADNLFQRFLRATDPDRVFVIPPGRPVITYREAFAAAARLAHVLAAHGVTPGDRVAVQVEKSSEALFLYLACLRVGAVYLPLNTGYTPTELAYFVGDAEPRLLVCSEKNRPKIAATLPATELLTLSDDGASGSLMAEAADKPADFADAEVSMNDLASILYTSGTTGRSKGAMLSHGNLCSNAQTLKQAWRYTDRDVLLHALPIFHIHGLFVASNITLISGAAMILLPKFDLDAIFKALPDASVMMGVPTFYTRMLQDSRLNLDSTRHMRLFVSGSAPLLAETHRQWRQRTGHEILERYGMTETNMNTSNPYEGARIPGSVGMPLPGVELRIADKDGAPLPQGEFGMIPMCSRAIGGCRTRPLPNFAPMDFS
jgi:malonyl-CoA/methylmalonyl-CoA synthetase